MLCPHCERSDSFTIRRVVDAPLTVRSWGGTPTVNEKESLQEHIEILFIKCDTCGRNIPLDSLEINIIWEMS